ncbi:substrate-binding domain-containing protein [Salidesulfovibrio onnuriiensis]|uniref:substrate-binding domain-containing protein n=1 Tax=Salidesulfovibrio onnuriiensis TaxID=2583823 RepID=UPI0011C76F1D|nr:substrate-binding domain-containing protein [Salidesulfovibrio onnuriiensis]
MLHTFPQAVRTMTVALCAVILAAGLATTAQAKELRIGFLLKTMQEERYRTDKALFMARAEGKGATVLFDSSRNDELVQLRQVEKMLDQGIQVLVLQPVETGTAGSLVKLAHERGVRVVGYDSMLQNGPLDVMVMQDSWAVGELQAKALKKWLLKHRGAVKGNVALIMGRPGDANAEAMSQGMLDFAAKHPDINLVARKSHMDWSPDLARETAETLLLKHRDRIDAFICNNSGLASGVMGALHEQDLDSVDKVFVAGSDADLRNIRMVAQGRQAFEVWKKIKPLAYRAADIAVAMAEQPEKTVKELAPDARAVDNGFAEIPTIITPVVGVDRENLDATVIADGHFTHEEVYGK